jgi:hypothetical protein
MHWTLLEEMGFNVIKVLRSIAQQFQVQIDLITYDDSYLLRTVAERYFIEVEHFFNPINLAICQNAWIQTVGTKRIHEYLVGLLEFRLFMLDHLKRWTTAGLNEINSNYTTYFKEYKRYDSRAHTSS